MNRFNLVKTIQLILIIGVTIATLLIVFLNRDVYSMIASHAGVRVLAILLWIVLGLSFIFLYFDFRSYADLKRENTELDNAIYSDALTGIANRYSVDVFISQFQGKPVPKDMGCVTAEIINLNEINRTKGHEGGDAAIQIFSDVLLQASNGVCFIGRNGGNKFVAIFRECSERKIRTFLDSLENGISAANGKHPDAAIRYITGTAFEEGDAVHTLTELVALSDRRAFDRQKS